MRSKNKKIKFNVSDLEPHVFVLVGLCLLVVGVGLLSYKFMRSFSIAQPVQTACTLDAKLCPDGSSVGRTGPNCEFAACLPATSGIASLHEKYGFAFTYPEGFNVSESRNNIIAQNHRGHIWVQVISKKLDPDNIIGLHGKIDPAEVRVRDVNYRQWYRFTLRDKRCSGPQYQTALGASILAVSFITCQNDNVDEALPIANDWDMIEEFLRSFKTD